MSFTVPYHLDPLDYERKAFGPFTSRELKYGGIGIVLAAVVGGALWFAPLSVPELFRVMPAIAVAFPFFYVANTKAPPGYESPEEYMRERLASALSGEDVYKRQPTTFARCPPPRATCSAMPTCPSRCQPRRTGMIRLWSSTPTCPRRAL